MRRFLYRVTINSTQEDYYFDSFGAIKGSINMTWGQREASERPQVEKVGPLKWRAIDPLNGTVALLIEQVKEDFLVYSEPTHF